MAGPMTLVGRLNQQKGGRVGFRNEFSAASFGVRRIQAYVDRVVTILIHRVSVIFTGSDLVF